MRLELLRGLAPRSERWQRSVITHILQKQVGASVGSRTPVFRVEAEDNSLYTTEAVVSAGSTNLSFTGALADLLALQPHRAGLDGEEPSSKLG